MKRSRFTEEQIIGVLKEHQAGMSAADLRGPFAGRDDRGQRPRRRSPGQASDRKRPRPAAARGARVGMAVLSGHS